MEYDKRDYIPYLDLWAAQNKGKTFKRGEYLNLFGYAMTTAIEDTYLFRVKKMAKIRQNCYIVL